MEARFPIRLIAMDLDGTLVGSDLVLGPRTVAAFRAAVADGVQITIIAKSTSAGYDKRSVTAVQATSTGTAPAAPPMTMFCVERRFRPIE